jgi:hypothetical protein
MREKKERSFRLRNQGFKRTGKRAGLSKVKLTYLTRKGGSIFGDLVM